MALDNVSPERFNQGVGNSNPFDLLLPTWAGEIITAYESYNVFEGLVTSETISSGTEKRFPMTGRVGLVESWDAGVALEGGGGPTSDFSISLDARPMASHIELDRIDEMVQQFSYRSAMLTEMGRKLAKTRDQRLARVIAKAAGSTAQQLDESGVDSDYAGTVYAGESAFDGAADEAQAERLLAIIEADQVRRMELDIPTTGMLCAVSPALFMQLRSLGLLSGTGAPAANLSTDRGGLGLDATRGMGMQDSIEFQGCKIFATNHVPSGNFTVGGGTEAGDANYAGDFSKTKALLWSPGAVASIRKEGMMIRTEDDVRRNSHFVVAQMYSGAGVIQPELAARIDSAS